MECSHRGEGWLVKGVELYLHSDLCWLGMRLGDTAKVKS